MEFTELVEKLRDIEKRRRIGYWKLLPNLHEKRAFTQSEADALRQLLLEEQDLECRTSGMLYLDRILHTPVQGGGGLHDWLFEPFRVPQRGSGGKRSVVLTVCDNAYIRDVGAQIEIARLLPSSRYSSTEFHHVPLEDPDWGDVGLDGADGVCFIGRPSMFRDCRIVKHFPDDLRFSIVPPNSAEEGPYFCINHNRPKAGHRRLRTMQDASRHDHAIVQRFMIRVGGRDMVVVVVAGATSLGTLGAARWISSFKWDKETRIAHASIAGLEGIKTSTRFEVLLDVSAKVNDPAKPWRPEFEPKSLFLHKSRNLLRAPSSISLATSTGSFQSAADVQYLLFDEDELEFGPTDRAAVVAVCGKQYLEKRSEILFDEFKLDQRLWPNGTCPIGRSPAEFFREHLQRRCLNGVIEVAGDCIRLEGCQIKIIRA